MKAREILEHFYHVCDFLDPNATNDRVVVGDPEKEVKTGIVTWISSFDACREAARRKVDLLVTHEPTFWGRRTEEEILSDPLAVEKHRFIQDSGLTIVRIHDAWDRFPKIGIPFAWAQYLGLGGQPVAQDKTGTHHRYDINPMPAGEFTQNIARRTAEINEPIVHFIGNPEKVISHIGIGTGCGCNMEIYASLGCDFYVVCDDGTVYWSHIQRSADAGIPVIWLNHGTTEDPGMATLTQYLTEQFPAVSFEYLPRIPHFVLIGGE